MLKPRLEIPRLTEDEMREMVLDRLACQVMFGTEVRERDVAMVFGCALVFPGILMPPPELIEKHLGSSEPPETLEGEPPRPEHPGYPEGAGDPQRSLLFSRFRTTFGFGRSGVSPKSLHSIGQRQRSRLRTRLASAHGTTTRWHGTTR
jgi:hypothetical protein